MVKTHLIKYFFLLIMIFIYIYDCPIKYSLKEKILLKGRKYLNRKIDTKFVNPKVTVIIPVYNCQNSIKQVIRSIQNQKMINIEIMLVLCISSSFKLEFLILPKTILFIFIHF